MFPISDHNPSGRTPLITYLLLIVNILVFVYSLTLGSGELDRFIYNYSVIPADISSGVNYYTLFTSMFLHGSFGHIIGNMLFLHIFGDNMEDKLGHVKFLLYYLVCGLGASFLQILVAPGVTIPNLGASGAIAGIMGGYILLFPSARIDTIVTLGYYIRRVAVPAYFMLVYWFIAQLLSGVGSLASLDQSFGGVAYFAHIGGFVIGLVFALPAKVRNG